MPRQEGPPSGLRERKRAKTRAAIQEHALRLFREHGYEATTVQQVAEAAEVSPSTFFRYFPSKEDVVMYDSFDAAIIEAIRAQPSNVSSIGAIRAGLHAALGQANSDEIARQNARGVLILSVPELRARMLDELLRATLVFSEVIAERVGHTSDDIEVRALVGAVFGVGLVTWFSGPQAFTSDYLKIFDRSLDYLEASFRL